MITAPAPLAGRLGLRRTCIHRALSAKRNMFARGFNKAPGKPDFLYVSVNGGRRAAVTMAHPDCPSGPAPSGAGPHPACSACTRTGVPLSVWPAIPPPGPCPASLPLVPCPHRWPAAAAAAVITAFTSPGDLVVTPDPGAGVFAAAAAGAGRRTHGPAEPAALLAGSCPDAGQAALAVVTVCGTPGCPEPRAGRLGAAAAGPGVMFAACHRVLAAGGLLAVITNAACHPGHAGDITASARAAGLVYTQHIIAVHAAISGSRLRLPAEAPAPPPGRPAGPHRPVHSDILLFRLPGGPRHD